MRVPSKMTSTDKCWEGERRVSDMGAAKRRGAEWRGGGQSEVGGCLWRSLAAGVSQVCLLLEKER